nr:uncharacterized protein LOC109167354 [Ipomoea trifida]
MATQESIERRPTESPSCLPMMIYHADRLRTAMPQVKNVEAEILSKLAISELPDHLSQICRTEIVERLSSKSLLVCPIADMLSLYPDSVTQPEWFWIAKIMRYKDKSVGGRIGEMVAKEEAGDGVAELVAELLDCEGESGIGRRRSWWPNWSMVSDGAAGGVWRWWHRLVASATVASPMVTDRASVWRW